MRDVQWVRGQLKVGTRLVTRGDFDGLACSVLITKKEKINEIILIHPQDITDGRADIRPGDILANVPYHPHAAKWFDHHLLTPNNPQPPKDFDGVYRVAPSAARLVYEYYGGRQGDLAQFDEMVQAADKIDAARLTPKDVTDPQGWVLLGYTIDGRSSLGPFRAYFHLLNTLLKTQTLDAVLKHPKVAERIARMRQEDAEFRAVLEQCSRVEGKVVISDLRSVAKVPAGNRFFIYTLFPDVYASIRLQWGPERKFVVATLGHSVFNRTCKVAIGELVSRWGGGGHYGAGATPLAPENVEAAVAEMVAVLNANQADRLA